MFTLFLENKRLLTIMLVIIVFLTMSATQQVAKTGYLSGSIGIINKSEGFVPSPDLKISLMSSGKKKLVISDENGDFLFFKLPVGKYCVSSIQDKIGTIFQIKDSQNKCFEIKKKQTTRFDIIIVKIE